MGVQEIMEEHLSSEFPTKILLSTNHTLEAWALKLYTIKQTCKFPIKHSISIHILWLPNKIRMMECLNLGSEQILRCISKFQWHPLTKWYQCPQCNINTQDSHSFFRQKQFSHYNNSWWRLLKGLIVPLINSNSFSNLPQPSLSFITSRCRHRLFNNTCSRLLNLNIMWAIMQLMEVRAKLLIHQVQCKDLKA